MLISRENMPVKSNPVNKNVGHHSHATNMETVNLLSLKKSSRHKIVEEHHQPMIRIGLKCTGINLKVTWEVKNSKCIRSLPLGKKIRLG